MRRALAACLLLCASAARAQERAPSGVRIVASGDVLLHIKVNEAAAQHGYTRLFASLSPHLPESAIAFANLETPLVDDVRDVVTGSPPTLGSRPEAAPALAAAGFDVLSFANNHAFDQGSAGAVRTLDAVQEARMHAVGTSRVNDDPWTPHIEVRGDWRVAFLATTDGLNQGAGRPVQARVALFDEERLEAAIAAARAVADLVVLSVHWSYDYAPRVSRRQRRRAREWVAAGVDFVIGTGPHVLHPVERLESPRGDALIAYSLGNLISNQGQRWEPGRRVSMRAHAAVRIPDTRDGALLAADFTRDDAGRLRLRAPSVVPLHTENNFWRWWFDRSLGHDIRVVPLRSAAEAVVASRLPAITEALGAGVRLQLAP